jgi:hypothetical protein
MSVPRCRDGDSAYDRPRLPFQPMEILCNRYTRRDRNNQIKQMKLCSTIHCTAVELGVTVKPSEYCIIMKPQIWTKRHIRCMIKSDFLRLQLAECRCILNNKAAKCHVHLFPIFTEIWEFYHIVLVICRVLLQ